jgi:hypothetical protein
VTALRERLLAVCLVMAFYPAFRRVLAGEVGLVGSLALLGANLALGVAGAGVLVLADWACSRRLRPESLAAANRYVVGTLVAGVAGAVALARIGDRLASSIVQLVR